MHERVLTAQVAHHFGLDPDHGGPSSGGPERPLAVVRSGSNRSREIKLIRLDDEFPSIVVNFKDAPGNEVKCPAGATCEVIMECTATNVTFELSGMKTKTDERGQLLISADSLQLTTGELQTVTPVDICVKVSVSGQELPAELKAKVTTGPPEKMVLKAPPEVSTIEPSIGLPKLCLQLQDQQGRACVLSSSNLPFVKYTVTLNGKPVNQNGKQVLPAELPSSRFNEQGVPKAGPSRVCAEACT